MKYFLFLIAISCALKTNAQNYLIAFTGTGESTSVTSVTAENLRTGTLLTLNGSDILRLNVTTGINSIENNHFQELKIYPNPSAGHTIVQIYPPESGNATVTIADMEGKLVARFNNFLENTLQEFQLSGLNSGIYFITVNGNNYQYSGKILCNSNNVGTISLEKISNIQMTDLKKVAAGTKGDPVYVDMEYNAGDRLKFTGVSGIYCTIISDVPEGSKTISFGFVACTDGDNNNYSVVNIGNQVWMAENLRTTKYSNGELIGTTIPSTLDITGEILSKYQWAYNGNEAYVLDYGRLYTCYALTDTRNICPSGWHYSTNTEWTILINFLGGNLFAGGKLKECNTDHWISPNEGATNEMGFTALPGGKRNVNGTFGHIGASGSYWSPEDQNPQYDKTQLIEFPVSVISSFTQFKNEGYSVRCLKD